MTTTLFHIIYTKDEMLLSRKTYSSWKEIQEEYEGYLASLGPWEQADVVEFLSDEYSNLSPPPEVQIENFLALAQLTCSITFFADRSKQSLEGN